MILTKENLEKFQHLIENDLSVILSKHHFKHVEQYNHFRRRNGRDCHPPGTRILTTNGEVSIENLTKDDKIISWDQESYRIRGGFKTKNNKSEGYNFSLHERYYQDNLIELSSEGFSHLVTKGHYSIVKLKDGIDDHFAVYIMQKGLSWRIGKTQLFHSSTRFGLSTRSVAEGADNTWMVGIYKTNSDAILAEEYFSCKYGIPKSLFLATKGKKSKWNGLYKWVTQEQLDDHHQSLTKPYDYYKNVLLDLGLDINYPIWTKGRLKFEDIDKSSRISKNRAITIRSSNIVNDFMLIGLYPNQTEDPYKISWKNVSVKKVPYNGKVFSLDVEKYHTYFANNILTHNCPFCKAATKLLFIAEKNRKGDDFLIRLQQNKWDGYE